MNSRTITSPVNRFCLVDFASRFQRGFRNNIISVWHVPFFIWKFRARECYTSCFLFPNDLKEHMDKNRDPETGKTSVAGYKGPVCANYLVIDIDSEDLGKARTETMKMTKFLIKELGTGKEAVIVSFSGNKGFHVQVDARIFGQISPSENLHQVFSLIRERLVDLSKVDESVVDFSIKDKLRLFRLPNTVNQKSGLYKIQLPLGDLFRLKPYQIRNRARKPQPQFHTDRTGLIPVTKIIKPIPEAQQFYLEAKNTVSRRKEYRPQVARAATCHLNTEIKIGKVFCKSEQIIALSCIQKGHRNNSAIRLIAKARAKGFSRNAAEEFIKKWNRECKINLSDKEMSGILRSVYSGERGYRYGCTDKILENFCPFKKKREDCEEYRRYKLRTIAD